jgi:hypothetical protein
MKRPGFLSKLFSRRAARAVAKVKSEVVTLPNWESLLEAVWERATMLEGNQVFMFHLKNPKSKLIDMESPTLIVGRLKGPPDQDFRDADYFVTAMGSVSTVVEHGSEDAIWERIGFQLEKTKQNKSFGHGPIPIRRLTAVLTSALDTFHLFYGVSSDSRIRNTGDAYLQVLLEINPGIRRVRMGEFRFR